MQDKQITGLFLGIFCVVGILGILASIALPHVGQMINKSKIEARGVELHNIQTAVFAMLTDSIGGTLEPCGPTTNMSQVRTKDKEPLVLSEYLIGKDSGSLKSGCSYIFAADGTVSQIIP